MKKPSILLGALILSASPASADDYLYLRCKASVDIVTTNSTTSKIIEKKKVNDIAIIKIDFIKKTILDTRSEGPLSFKLRNNIMNTLTNSDDHQYKINDDFKLNLTPPISYSQRGTVVFKLKNETYAHSSKGSCEEVDASVFEKALSQ